MSKKTRISWGFVASLAAICLAVLTVQRFHAKEIDRHATELQLAYTEQALAKEQAESRALALKASDAYCSALDELRESAAHGYAQLDARGRVVEWNQALEEWTGYSESEMVGRDIARLMPADKAQRHREGMAAFLADPKLWARPIRITCDLTARDGRDVTLQVVMRAIAPVGDGAPTMIAFIYPAQWLAEAE